MHISCDFYTRSGARRQSTDYALRSIHDDVEIHLIKTKWLQKFSVFIYNSFYFGIDSTNDGAVENR